MIKQHIHRIAWSFVGLAIAGLLVYGGLWAALAISTKGMSNEWIAAQRQQGWSVSVSEPRLDGFPFWPSVVLENIAITAPLENGAWSWATDRVTVHPSTFDLTHLTIRAPGRHMFELPRTTNGLLYGDAKVADFEIDLDTQGRLQRGNVLIEQGEIQDASRLPLVGASQIDLELALAEANTGSREVFARFTGQSDDLRFAANLRPFDSTVRTIRLEAELIGAVTPGRLQDALNLWRRGGGTLEVRRLVLDWPPLTLDADGTMALDEDLQPIAAFSTRITGFNDTLGALETQGFLPRGQAKSAEMVLNLLARTPRGSDTPELQVPLSVQDQRLSVGPFDVMDVPTMRWD